MNKISVVNILATVHCLEFCENGKKLWFPCLHSCLGVGYCCWHTWNSSRNCSKQGTPLYISNLNYEPCFDVLGWRQVKDLKMWALLCRDPSYEAFKLGVAASIFLVFAHASAHFLGGCICMRSKEECEGATANRQLAVAFLILSWYVFFNMCCFKSTHVMSYVTTSFFFDPCSYSLILSFVSN